MNEHNLVGHQRNGEGPFWKYLRLWPVVLTLASVIAAYAVMADNQQDLSKQVVDNNIAHKIAIEVNRKAVELLKQQSIRVEGQLERVNEKLEDQKVDMQDILMILRTRPMQ